MKLIAGLGNPGAKYKKNRHNLGFMVLDKLVIGAGISWRFSQDWVCYHTKTREIVYVKPNTFMNQSGVAIAAAADFYKVEMEDVLVIYDEVDLPFGKIRLSSDGLSAGHHGIDSVIEKLGGNGFCRLRVGIDHPKNNNEKNKQEVSDYVLEDFTEGETKKLPVLLEKCSEAVDSFINDGIEATMNRFN